MSIGRGSRLLEADTTPAQDDTATRRRGGWSVEVTLRWRDPGANHADVLVLPLHGGRTTRVEVTTNSLNGSSDVEAQVRGGTCKRLGGFEFPLLVSSNGDGVEMDGEATISVPFADVPSTPYVLEILPDTDSSSVIACGRLDA